MLGQSELPGAAWYPDPYGASTLRWWDGVQWTDAVHPPVGTPTPAPPPASTAAIPTVQANVQPTAPIATQPQLSAPVVSEVVTAPTSGVVPAAVPAYPTTSPTTPVASHATPPGRHVSPPSTPLGLRAAAATIDEDSGAGRYEWSRESRAFDTFPGSAMPMSIAPRLPVTSALVTGTASAWTIVFMPLLAVIGIVAVMLVIASVPALQVTGFPSELLLASIAAAFYLVTVLFALADNRRLYSNGMDRPPHWAWSLLTAPVYLAARVVAVKQETGRLNLGQLIVHVLLLAGAAFLALNFTDAVWPYLVSLMAGL